MGLKAKVTDLASEAGAWLAPLPSAVFAAGAAQKHLHFDNVMGFIAGAVVELLGLATANRAFALWEYNATRDSDQPSAPTWIAGVMFILYMAATIGLSVLADINTDLAKWLPAIFPVMAMAGTVTMALGRQHELRLTRNQDVKDDRVRLDKERKAEQERLRLEAKADEQRKEAERKAEREARRLERKATKGQTSTNASTDGSIDASIDKLQAGRAAKKAQIIDAMLDAYRVNPHLGDTELGGMVGVTRQTVYNYRSELESAGRIHKNGNGVEILWGE